MAGAFRQTQADSGAAAMGCHAYTAPFSTPTGELLLVVVVVVVMLLLLLLLLRRWMWWRRR